MGFDRYITGIARFMMSKNLLAGMTYHGASDPKVNFVKCQTR